MNKPWESAEPGEIWYLIYDDEVFRFFALEGRRFVAKNGTTVSASSVTGGIRIVPKVTEEERRIIVDEILELGKDDE